MIIRVASIWRLPIRHVVDRKALSSPWKWVGLTGAVNPMVI